MFRSVGKCVDLTSCTSATAGMPAAVQDWISPWDQYVAHLFYNTALVVLDWAYIKYLLDVNESNFLQIWPRGEGFHSAAGTHKEAFVVFFTHEYIPVSEHFCHCKSAVSNEPREINQFGFSQNIFHRRTGRYDQSFYTFMSSSGLGNRKFWNYLSCNSFRFDLIFTYLLASILIISKFYFIVSL